MLNKIISEDKIQQTKKLIAEFDKIVIVSHMSPDGDAIGSSLGLYHFLTRIGKQVNIIVPDSFPGFLKWMKGVNDITVAEQGPQIVEETIAAAKLIFCLDFNALKRIAQLGPWIASSSAKKIMIDHHPDPDDFCDITISYPEISSCSELIFRLICRLGMFEYINLPGAESIYTGMMTDTGAFTYNSNNPQVYFIIGELLRIGIDKDAIFDKVYNNYTESRIRLQGYILYEKMKLFPEYKTALVVLSKEESRRFNANRGDTEGFVNIPLSMKGVVFSVFIREDGNMVKISLRSKGNFPTNEFSSDVFGGGGHLNASGGEFYGKLEDAVSLFEKALPRYKNLLQ